MLSQDREDEAKRIEERNRKIEQMLHPTDSKVEAVQDCKETTPHRTYCGRPLHPWEVLVKGRPVQFRPMTSREVEAMDEKTMMENIKRQDQEHQRKVQAAIRERDAEQKDMDKRREHEKTTGRREYGKERFISLDEARRRGYLASENTSNGEHPEWWSPGNEEGLFANGR